MEDISKGHNSRAANKDIFFLAKITITYFNDWSHNQKIATFKQQSFVQTCLPLYTNFQVPIYESAYSSDTHFLGNVVEKGLNVSYDNF
jgi:hypothetical protein